MLHSIYRKLFSVLMALFVVVAFMAPASGTRPAAAQTAPGQQFERLNIKPRPISYRYDKGAKPYHFDPPARPKLASMAMATVNIHYVPAGSQNYWSKTCVAFPESAKTALNAAAQVWSNLLVSAVPINIEACWADLPEGVLGQSGATGYWGNVSVIYPNALANALAGVDKDPSSDDMSITYANAYTNAFYYGTDGNTPADKIDFMSVVLHEIAHGLGFSGTMWVDNSTGEGEWGFMDYQYPLIYDKFTIDPPGNYLLNTSVYPNPSTKLGTTLTSGVYFYGANARAANGGNAVKLYTPYPWEPGSSYSHLDYDTYRGTPNTLMVYAIGNGSSIHDPGPIGLAVLKDIGWKVNDVVPLPGAFNKSTPGNGATGIATSTTISWTPSTGADHYIYCYDTSNNSNCDGTWSSPVTGTSATISGLTAGTTYYWEVWAVNSAGNVGANSNAWWSFTTLPSNPPGAFNKSAPSNGASGVPLSTTLSWTPASGADHYVFCYDTSNNSNCDGSWSPQITGTSSTISGLAAGTTYYWQVWAVNAAGTVDANSGAWWSFNTAGPVSTSGDVNCDSTVNVTDGLFILQYDVLLRQAAYSCPLTGTSLNVSSCDVNKDSSCNVVDGLFVLQCDVGLHNTLCPGTNAPSGDQQPSAGKPGENAMITVGSGLVSQGKDVTVPLQMQANAGAPAAITVEIHFNPEELQIKDCSADPDGVFAVEACNTSAAPGVVRLSVVSTSGKAGALNLAQLTFRAVKSSGSASLTVSPVTVANQYGSPAEVTVQNGMVTISNLKSMYLPLVRH